MRRTRLLRTLPALAWAGVIFVASSIPSSELPGGFSLQGHVIEYLVFGALVLFALAEIRPGVRRLLPYVALVLCALYAASDEVHQAFVPGRVPDPADWTVDVVASALGIAGTYLFLARRGWTDCGD